MIYIISPKWLFRDLKIYTKGLSLFDMTEDQSKKRVDDEVEKLIRGHIEKKIDQIIEEPRKYILALSAIDVKTNQETLISFLYGYILKEQESVLNIDGIDNKTKQKIVKNITNIMKDRRQDIIKAYKEEINSN